jgi:hypothetical protein
MSRPAMRIKDRRVVHRRVGERRTRERSGQDRRQREWRVDRSLKHPMTEELRHAAWFERKHGSQTNHMRGCYTTDKESKRSSKRSYEEIAAAHLRKARADLVGSPQIEALATSIEME